MKRLTLLASDIVALYGSLAVVLLARYGSTGWSYQYALHVVPFSGLFVIWLLSLYIANLYEQRSLRNNREFFERLAQAVSVAGLLSVLFFYLIPYFGITPRTNLFLFIIVFALLETGMRVLANIALASGAKKRVLIVGVTEQSVKLAEFIQTNPQLGWTVRAMAPLGQQPLPLVPLSVPSQLLDERADLGAYIRSKNIDTVVVSPEAYEQPEVMSMLYGAIAAPVTFLSLIVFGEHLTGTVPLGAVSQQWLLENIAQGSKRSYEAGRRVIDIAAVLLMGAVTMVLTPFIALAIKLDSSGPVLFRQKRTGQGGVPFDIIKFRTMGTDAEKNSGATWATPNDPRVTRVGRFLRLSRLDELPQLWNILVGSMSLVGPRAERPEFDAKLAQQVPFYRERYLVRPGLSGWAQINYPYGASTQDAMRKLEYDLYYLKNRSLALDIEVILKTITISLRRAGR